MKLINWYCIPENSLQFKSKFIPTNLNLIELGFIPDWIWNYYISKHEWPYLFWIWYEEWRFYVWKWFYKYSYVKTYANIESLKELQTFVNIFHTNDLIDNFEI